MSKFAYIHFNAKVTAAIGKEHRSLWTFYSTLKRNLGKRNSIHKKDLHTVSDSLPYSYHTVRKNIESLVKGGYAVRTKKGYVLLSIKKVAATKFGSKFGYKYKYVVASSKFEVAARASYLCFEESRRKQLYVSSKQASKVGTKPSHILRCLPADEQPTVSVRWVSSSVGYTSPMTGSKIEKAWERLGLVSIKRSISFACKVDEYSAYCKADPDAPSKCFVVGDDVYKRDINKIRVKGGVYAC